MADFELYARDSKNVVIPVRDEGGNYVDLTTADIRWVLSEWMGGPPILEKTRTAGGASDEIGIEQSSGQPYPASMVVKILPDDVLVAGGIYTHHARISFVDARDTVKVGVVDVKDAPAA